MARYGYGYVTEKGFVAFSHDLTEGAWAEVSIKGYDGAQRMLPSNPMEVPRDVAWKLRATWAIATLAVAGYGLATATWQLAAACVLVNGLEAAGTVAWASDWFSVRSDTRPATSRMVEPSLVVNGSA